MIKTLSTMLLIEMQQT